MDFNFQPTIKVNKDSVIEGIDYETPRNNFVTINKVDYIFKKLDENGNKGGNSIILKLYANANIQSQQDYSDLDDIKPDRILKILKFDYKTYKKIPNYKKTHKRFLNEIQALSLCKVPLTLNVIEIFENGSCYIAGNQYLYYTMEFADDDLKSHIEKTTLI
ncbi:MAG: hypothetical protein IPF62_11545 [Bacteroidetes bacterium]|nr:hypothetical protein [Bacteroidota bacterium]